VNWITNYVRPKINSMLGRREVPENLWIKCPETGEMVFHNDLEENHYVIPASGYHMKMSAEARLKHMFDGGKYELLPSPEGAAGSAEIPRFKEIHRSLARQSHQDRS
jgi:acetyl-CoA carboxylase carboxyl transferase subunit beta